MHQLIISRLIESGIEIFLPLSNSEIFLIKTNHLLNIILPCKSVIASSGGSDQTNSPVARVNRCKITLAVLDEFSRTVWLLPESFCSDQVNLRMGEKLEEFILPEPSSLSFLEQKEKRSGRLNDLQEQARNMIRNKQETLTCQSTKELKI